MMQRVAVIGNTGSGKSTLAECLAAILGGSFVDIDALNWGPDWTPAPVPVLREQVTAALAGDCWAVAGNYSAVRDIIWRRADTIVWLDYPLPLVLRRLFRRTVRRVATRQKLWGGNREHFRVQFASRDSLFLFALKAHGRRRREYPVELARPEYAHLCLMRFRQPEDTEQWLNSLS